MATNASIILKNLNNLIENTTKSVPEEIITWKTLLENNVTDIPKKDRAIVTKFLCKGFDASRYNIKNII